MPCLERGKFLPKGLAHLFGIRCHQLKPILNQCFKCLLVGYRPQFPNRQTWWYFFDTGQAQLLQPANVHPADVKLVRPDRQLGRRGIGVMIVMQLFTGNQNAPRRDIGAGVRSLKIAITPIMRSTVDDARGHHRSPHHLHGPNGETSQAKKQQIDQQHQHDAKIGKPAVQVTLDPVIGCSMSIAGQCFCITRLFAVQLITLQQNGPDAVDMRTMGVVVLLAFGVMLAVNGCPLPGDLPGCQPQPETKEMGGNRVQVERTVRLVPMQEDRHADHGDVCHNQSEQHHLPAAQVQNPTACPVQNGIHQ